MVFDRGFPGRSSASFPGRTTGLTPTGGPDEESQCLLRIDRGAAVRLLLVALLAAVSVALASSQPARATAPAAISETLEDWLASADAAASVETIVTFDDRASVSRIDRFGEATKLAHLPMALTTLTGAQIREVASWPEVRSLWHNQRMKLYLDESVPLTKADRVAAGAALKRPYTGVGVGVGVIDTGTDALHPDLAGKVEGYALVGEQDLFDEGKKEPMFFVPTPTGDTYGHGTHVASTIAGSGVAHTTNERPFAGMATGARIYSFKTDVGPYLFGGPILASFDWMLSHNADPATTVKIRVSSNSWGCCDGTDYNPDDPINVATKMLYDAGITVVFAASNSGGPNTLNQYATSPWVVSVAAGTKSLALADFSSRGRFDSRGGTVDVNWDRRKAQRQNSGVYRPTITAPGVDIAAAKSSQATLMADGTDPENPLYTYASGTSMATPHVSGAVALMLEARPTLQPQHVIDILEGTADDMPAYEIFEVGMGHLDAHEAVQAAEKGKIRFPPPVNGKTPSFTVTSSNSFGGTVATGTWSLARCPDTLGVLNHHHFDVGAGTDAIYTEIEWADPTQLVYLVLYDPGCNEAGVSAALLDIGSVNHRALLVTNPVAGRWTVGVYGRINLPTPYTGAFSTYRKR
jgi:serine protease AprX